ncbi:hypothetical protein M378DRAFT_173896, partial [Amanita muscaria Koide BX008]
MGGASIGGCYKTILVSGCSLDFLMTDYFTFYEKCGFQKKEKVVICLFPDVCSCRQVCTRASTLVQALAVTDNKTF